MIEKFLKKLVLCILTISFLTGPVYGEINPKVKALGLMAAYGTVGGSLLGLASLAFGAEGRSVAKGASLGLYTGIAFGAFVVISHRVKQDNMNNPGDDYYPATPANPYSSESDFSYNNIHFDSKVASSSLEELSLRMNRNRISQSKFYFNLLSLNF